MTFLAPYVVEAPLHAVLDLDEVKAHLRVDYADEDGLIELYYTAAEHYLDGPRGILGRALYPQIWGVELDASVTSLALPFPDVQAVEAYIDGAPVASEFARSGLQYLVEGDGFDKLHITLGMGAYTGTPGEIRHDIPASLKLAMYMLIGHWFEHRIAVNGPDLAAKVPLAFDAIISPYKWHWL